ncbi:MAG: endonuclease Q family protein [Clostridia bacterium]|nr:endonuclease Q family protein [Clostridia bacterium]
MDKFFMDLHVHIGRSDSGRIIKMATAKNLTIYNVAKEAHYRKGLDIAGVVDCISPYVLEDIDFLIQDGKLLERPDGGIKYGEITLILGAEIETKEDNGRAHILTFFPYLENIKGFAKDMQDFITNIYTNSSIANISGRQLIEIVEQYGGICIPAHIFTPYKSCYGSCADRLEHIFGAGGLEKIYAVELGLSADTQMACQISELDDKSFLSNSDAHSLPKLGREYNVVELNQPTYKEVVMALKGEAGRRINANYGLDPKLGKYHRTFCIDCNRVIEQPPPVEYCPIEKEHKTVMGVMDRLYIIKDKEMGCSSNKPPYHYQVPLEYLPGVGPKTIDRLIKLFGNEMNVLHKVSQDELKGVLTEQAAQYIISSREGRLKLEVGGGGVYGRVEKLE